MHALHYAQWQYVCSVPVQHGVMNLMGQSQRAALGGLMHLLSLKHAYDGIVFYCYQGRLCRDAKA